MKRSEITIRCALMALLCALLLCGCARQESASADITLPGKTETPQQAEAPGQGEAIEGTKTSAGGICVLLGNAASAASMRMAIGTQEYAAFSGLDISVRGSESGEDAKCAELIRSAVAEKPAALCIAFCDGTETDAALGEARAAGVKVVICGASGLKNIDACILSADNAVLGATIMDALAEAMGEKGSYALMCFSGAGEREDEIVNGAIEHQKEVYSEMKLLGEPIDCGKDSDSACKAALELLKDEPEIDGIAVSSDIAMQGAARAVDELGNKARLAGTGMPQENAGLLQNGFVSAMVSGDPSLDIQAACALTRLLLEGEMPAEHTDLGVVGYNDLSPVKNAQNVFAGNNITIVTMENLNALGY